MPAIKTRKVDVTDDFFGTQVNDPYRWLEKNNRNVRRWVDRQNKNSEIILKKTADRDLIRNRLERLYRIDSIGIPFRYGSRYFFQERKADKDLISLYVQEGLSGMPRILIDANILSEDKSTVISEWFPSNDGKLLAYGLSESANDQSSIRIMNVDTGENLPDFIPAEVYPCLNTPLTWNPDGSGFWYTRRMPDAPQGEEKFHQKIYYHELGIDYLLDPMIFGDDIPKEATAWINVSIDGRYLLISIFHSSDSTNRTDLYLLELKNKARGFVPIIKGIEAEFLATIHRNMIFMLTNYEAPLGKIQCINIDTALKDGVIPTECRTIIPESENKIESFNLIKDSLFVETLENIHSVFNRYNLDGEFISEIPFPTLGSLISTSYMEEGDELFFYFSSFLIPGEIYCLDLITGQIKLFKKIDIGINADNFKVKQVWYSSKDGTKIPMFLIHKKRLERNGNNPVLLYGYGGFDVSITPTFDRDAIPFIENGGIYAIANIRGGGEFGENWHESGIQDKKQNVFDDFIAAAEWLVKKNYTNSGRLAISGWSNGGLLTAVLTVQRPDLFKVAIIGAPVIDMLRFQLFFGGRHWIADYGCAEDPKMFKHLLAYSPYHNVIDGTKYPAVLIITATNDDRVHPMHAYKMAARLQEANVSANPILLLVETKAGHGSAPAISRLIETQADTWGFIFDQLDMRYKQ